MATVQHDLSQIRVTPGVHTLLRDLIHEHTGIFFEPERFDTLLDKLHSRAGERGCHSYLDYYYVLKEEEPGSPEWLRVIDAFSVQETYFWREVAQIRVLVDIVVPAWFKRHKLPLHIWSAGCATGEEPTSIAIALREAGWSNLPIAIHASDASEAALDKARAGVYRERSFRSLPAELRAKYFDPPAEGGMSRLRRELLHPISYQRANLVVPAEIAHRADVPVIFCRNVFIYFSHDAIRRTVATFAAHMPADSHLFVGASESLRKLTADFDLREIGPAFAYVRNPRSHP
jgi:chemotaxis protein methyltransferase CheR